MEFSQADFDFKVELMAEKGSNMVAAINDFSDRKGMVPLQLLEHAVGVLGWVTSVIPGARPWRLWKNNPWCVKPGAMRL